MIASLKHFKHTCSDFGVEDANIKILATEATRTAVNSADFRQRIKDATGWEVSMLAKEEEGRVGAMGVASSLGAVNGLMMDLGGGSTQLTWIMTSGDKGFQMPSTGAVSMPFGAAALTRGLVDADRQGKGARQRFADQIQSRIKEAYDSLNVPKQLHDLAKQQGGFALYLSGGGFRGWGFVLMNQHAIQPYPISVINGLRASRADFMDTQNVQSAVLDQQSSEDEAIFRVSQRRASQVPAVAFLVTALSSALPEIKEVRFCQGGVREGYLLSTLPPSIQSQSPLTVATNPYASASATHFTDLLLSTLPPFTTNTHYPGLPPPPLPSKNLITAYANTLFHFSTHPKDIRTASALRSTTTGFLASVHGLSHEERAALALLLTERWGGVKELPPTETGFFVNLGRVLDPVVGLRWWVLFLGRVGTLVGAVYPAGVVRAASGQGEGQRGTLMRFQAGWKESKKGHEIMILRISGLGVGGAEEYASEIEAIEKVGKKKNWVGGKDGYGYKIEVEVVA